MAERKTKQYYENGKCFRFDFDAFSILFNGYCKKHNLKRQDAEIKLGEAVGVSEHTIHSWRNRVNAPVDISLVVSLAKELGAKDTSALLSEKKEGYRMENLNERQVAAAKRVFDCIVEMLFKAKDKIDFYSDYYEEVVKRILDENPEMDASDISDEEVQYYREDFCEPNEELNYEFSRIDAEIEKARKVIAQEYFDLHDTEIYDKFSAFCENELFHAFFSTREGSEDNLSSYYLGAIKKLHAIIGTEADTSIFEKEPQKMGDCSEDDDELGEFEMIERSDDGYPF